MGQQDGSVVRELASKTDNVISISGTQMGKGESDYPRIL